MLFWFFKKDYHGSWDRILGANAPLYAHPSQNLKEYYIDYTVKYYIQGGFAANKIILGMGSYGRSMRLATAANYVLGSAATGAGAAGMVYLLQQVAFSF